MFLLCSQAKRVKRNAEQEINLNLRDEPSLLRVKRDEVGEPALVRVKRQKRDLTEQLDEALIRVKRNKRDTSEQELIRVKRGDVDPEDQELTRVCNLFSN